MGNEPLVFIDEDFPVRRIYDEEAETWYFFVVDIMAALTGQRDSLAAQKNWKKFKERLRREGCQSLTDCRQRKLPATDGRKYSTEVADPVTLMGLIQEVPGPQAEQVKRWLIERVRDQLKEKIEKAVSQAVKTRTPVKRRDGIGKGR